MTTSETSQQPTSCNPDVDPSPRQVWFLLATFAIIAGAVWQLRSQGRPWWCGCGSLGLWISDVKGSHCSQHLVDPYSFTHILHGVALYFILAWVAPRIALQWRGWLAVFLEAAWEIVENSQRVIEQYRSATIALGYEGDSVVNSMSDIVCCGLGFVIASRIGLRASIVLFIAIELLLLVWIRDNLTLNIVMLIHPIEAVKVWQMGK
jgi:hypothetical protein